MAQILNRSPFDEYVWQHSIAQMDFILEQYAKDNPDKLKFHRATDRNVVQENKSWSQVLHGAGLRKWLSSLTNMSVVEKIAKEKSGNPLLNAQQSPAMITSGDPRGPQKIVPRPPKPPLRQPVKRGK